MKEAGWDSIYEVFEVLNKNNVLYVVMRNYEEMHCDNFFCEGHEDIDFLCENTSQLVKIIKAKPKMGKDDGIHYYIEIDNTKVPIDIRNVNDNYYDPLWSKNILNDRIIASNGNWYVMNTEDYYYSLIYHVIIQKEVIQPSYINKLNKMNEKNISKGFKKDWKRHFNLLVMYMRDKGYRFVEPDDESVFFQMQYMPISLISGGGGILKKKVMKNFFYLESSLIDNLINILKNINMYDKLRGIIKRNLVCDYVPEKGEFRSIAKLNRKIEKYYFEQIYDQLAQRRLYYYLDIYMETINEKFMKERGVDVINKDVRINQTVFTCWLQGVENAPIIVKRCIESLEKLERPIVVITMKNIKNYLDIPQFILDKYERGIIGSAHFSDIIRVALLEKYGGTWVDSTVYIAEKVPEYMLDRFWLFKQSKQLKEVRMSGNWWISAEQGNEIVKKMRIALYTYWRKENTSYHYYLFHVMWAKIIESSEQYRNVWNMMVSRYTDTSHSLMYKFSDKYNEQEWKWIKQTSPVFKCTYKFGSNLDEESYYTKLIEGLLP